MKPGDKIRILPSFALSELKLEALVGLTATIVEVNGNFDGFRGCWVMLPGKYLGEREWYIPYNSIGV
ncbi:hypothetical protein [Bacteroides thetaiotaomicron]|uniref:hypothetical protein n=1 Tax=Bacteroides thetaiotaomicron TaxID=818 RepID=UPI00220C24A9|nr:MAG: hypothetical protein [Bacteriophage sp.]